MTADRKRIGIIGCGSRGIKCFGEIMHGRADVEVAALFDLNTVRLQSAKELLGGKPVTYTELPAMLKQEKLDAVVITSPDKFHEEHAVTALEYGCNLLVDKPLAITAKGCRRIIDIAAKVGKTVMIGFNLRQNQVLRRLKEIVDAGTLGKVFLIENREFYNGGRTYMARWNRNHEISGGLWIHKGSHDFDVFNWLLGFPKPVRVSAIAGIDVLHPQGIPFALENNVQPGPNCTDCYYAETCPDAYRIETSEFGREMWGKAAQSEDSYAKNTCIYLSEKSVHDNGLSIVEYENGAKASHLECFICSFTDRMYTIVGDRGVAEVSLHRRTINIYPRWKTGEVITYQLPEIEGGHGGADPMLVEAFVNVLKGRQPNSTTAEQGLWSTAIGQAAELAWRENRTVAISELES